MDFGLNSSIFIIYSLLLFHLQLTQGRFKNLDMENHLRFRINQDPSFSQLDPALNLFFHYNHLKLGNKMPIYFPKKNPLTSPRLLTKKESNSIPFTSIQLSHILQLFSFPHSSKQALAIKTTLNHCEFPPIKGETKFCATSLDFMLDSIHKIFGLNSHFKLLTTNYLTQSISSLQNYTIYQHPVEISAKKIVACHTLPYPYAVFYCHGQVSDNMLYKVMLLGDDGGRVEATAMCHMDTSQWDPDHVAFRVLKTTPGASPVCHFFPADNLVWIPLS